MSNTELGWKSPRVAPSLPESHATIRVPTKGGFWRTLLAFAGPGMMVAVGYMDPGNWATDLAGGSHFGFMLLSVVLISNLMAILLQHLSLKLGIATGRDLAQACRDSFSRPVSFVLWILCEVAIAACDLAEIIGSAIALNLLFGLPLIVGVCLTALDVLVILFLQNRGFRYLEAIIIGLIVLIAGCFLYEIVISRPDMKAVFGGLVPSPQVVFNPQALYIAIGILGATVMPHNLYLHSSIVQTRNYERSPEGKKRAVRFATIDSTVSLLIAFFINASILILAGTAFHGTVNADVDDIGRAYQLLAPVLGVSIAGTVFAIALLASGMNSTITGTLAGQIVMEGFLNIRLKPWLRRLVTRMIAIVPAIVVTIVAGSRGANALLILSQVILSMQLSFAVIPLVLFTSDKKKMGALVNPPWIKYLAFAVTAVIVGLNAYLLGQTFFS